MTSHVFYGSVIKIRMEILKIWQWSRNVYYWIDENLNNMTTCPHCQSSNIVKNGLTAYGKQNYRCQYCKRQSVEREAEDTFKREELLESLLLERISLRGIARILKVSLTWVVERAKQIWQSVPEELPTGHLSNLQPCVFIV
jgi:transposase-like protein